MTGIGQTTVDITLCVYSPRNSWFKIYKVNHKEHRGYHRGTQRIFFMGFNKLNQTE